ncbi:ATP-dependent Zn protease [Aminobacter sp. AP02]|uniref:ATP-dependent Zn protease n=1 Tax=Aminobacter sp. AP02 TaxID=2135737 RepID=UPI001304BF19|nr:ATP-dependent Zn protease [Aminobacter sp. AP02]
MDEIDCKSKAVLGKLARQASGLTGADIERIVREARQMARRERRPLSFADLQARLAGNKPVWPQSLRSRMAIHEAGHVVAHLILGTANIEAVTIDGRQGGQVEGETYSFVTQSEAGITAQIIAKLAGRAAEEEFLGTVSAGAGGSLRSDLGQATELALALETTLGFSKEMPLLYRQVEATFAQLEIGGELSGLVNDRLERAYGQARKLVRSHRHAVQAVADALLEHGTLIGPELNALLRDNGCNRNTES